MNEIRLVDFRAESLQFDMNHQFKPQKDENLTLAIKLDQRVRMSGTPKEPTFLNLRVTVFEDAQQHNYPFEIVADVTGVFLINAEGEDREALLKDNGMVMLLPYVRAMISQLVSLANLPMPVILPPLDPAQMQPVQQPNATEQK
ncbi:MAG: protein-export protein SecB [Pyramidobacter sp.]|jgi:preprotein translocase subunit SecB